MSVKNVKEFLCMCVKGENVRMITLQCVWCRAAPWCSLPSLAGALQIENSEESDQGKYECVAVNRAGTRYSAPANLYVRGKSPAGWLWDCSDGQICFLLTLPHPVLSLSLFILCIDVFLIFKIAVQWVKKKENHKRQKIYDRSKIW